MHWCFRDRDPLQLDECQYALLRYENQSYPLIKMPNHDRDRRSRIQHQSVPQRNASHGCQNLVLLSTHLMASERSDLSA